VKRARAKQQLRAGQRRVEGFATKDEASKWIASNFNQGDSTS